MATSECESATVSSVTLAGNTSIDLSVLAANRSSRARSAADLARSVTPLGQGAPSVIHCWRISISPGFSGSPLGGMMSSWLAASEMRSSNRLLAGSPLAKAVPESPPLTAWPSVSNRSPPFCLFAPWHFTQCSSSRGRTLLSNSTACPSGTSAAVNNPARAPWLNSAFTLIRSAGTFSLSEKESSCLRLAKQFRCVAGASWSATVPAAFWRVPKRCGAPHSKTLALPAQLPLPAGEGWGEGERVVATEPASKFFKRRT